MKIALVYDVLYPYVVGGAERRYYELAQHLSKKHDVHFFSMKFWEGPDVIQKDGMTFHGVCPAADLHGGSGKRSIKQALLFAKALYKPLSEFDFDVLDCSNMSYFSLFTCKRVCKKKGKRMITTWHEVWGTKYWCEYLGIAGIAGAVIERLTARCPDHIVAVSTLTRKRLRDVLGVNQPITTISNGLEYEQLTSIPAQKKKYDFIYSGRLSSHKNVETLVRAIAILNKIEPVSCIIVGEGPEKESLQTLTKELGLEDAITFKPFIKELDDVYRMWKSARVFALPSVREGFGMVVIEANACGVPVAVVKHPNNAASELIEKGVNGAVSENNPKAYARILSDLLHKHKSLAKSAKQHAKGFDWKLLAKQTEELYTQ